MPAALQSNNNPKAKETPLEDLMVAMDVVDTVRHRQILIDRELNIQSRREKLAERLREIYTAQGIEVSDEALESGIAALEDERFKYTPSPDTLPDKLAQLYVRRESWLKPVMILIISAISGLAIWYYTLILPAENIRLEIPQQLEKTFTTITTATTDDKALGQAQELLDSAHQAIYKEDFPQAEQIHDTMKNLLERIQQTYLIRIISRPDELSGVWRVPLLNQHTRNYYLIVEAIAPSGKIIQIPVLNEEDNKTYLVSKWGVRVTKDIFDAVSDDKRDDGIIQKNIIGRKKAGLLRPEYRVQTTGGTITDW